MAKMVKTVLKFDRTPLTVVFKEIYPHLKVTHGGLDLVRSVYDSKKETEWKKGDTGNPIQEVIDSDGNLSIEGLNTKLIFSFYNNTVTVKGRIKHITNEPLINAYLPKLIGSENQAKLGYTLIGDSTMPNSYLDKWWGPSIDYPEPWEALAIRAGYTMEYFIGSLSSEIGFTRERSLLLEDLVLGKDSPVIAASRVRECFVNEFQTEQAYHLLNLLDLVDGFIKKPIRDYVRKAKKLEDTYEYISCISSLIDSFKHCFGPSKDFDYLALKMVQDFIKENPNHPLKDRKV